MHNAIDPCDSSLPGPASGFFWEEIDPMVRRLLLVFLCTLVMSPAWADILIGKVVTVADGDTVTVLDGCRTQHKIRLSGIDTPERNQPFGMIWGIRCKYRIDVL